jgi:hypothetical protein
LWLWREMLLWCEAVRRWLADALGIAWDLVPSAVVCAIAEKIAGSDTFFWNVNRSMAGNGISIQRLHHARGVMSARITCTTSRLGSSHVNHRTVEVWAGLPTSGIFRVLAQRVVPIGAFSSAEAPGRMSWHSEVQRYGDPIDIWTSKGGSPKVGANTNAPGTTISVQPRSRPL